MENENGRSDVPDLIPARMLNEFAYCPRLAWLEWVQGDFADSADTVDGRHQHRRVDKEGGRLPAAADLLDAADTGEKLHARSVYLSAAGVGLVAKIDLVETTGQTVTPVDYKRGEAPDLPDGAWEPERVQVCAQGLILEENGYTTNKGVLYFVASKKRVDVHFTPELRERTRQLTSLMRATMGGPSIPPPLQDSPKCPRCSLVGICLPDETNLLRLPLHDAADGDVKAFGEPRRLLAARDDALPVYAQTGGTKVGKSGEEFVITPREGETQTARIGQTSQISLFGAVQMSTQALQGALGQGIPVCYFSTGGWFYGITTGINHKNVELRRLQYATAENAERSLLLAKRFVISKIRNSRTLLRRNFQDVPRASLDTMKAMVERANTATSAESLLGFEGTAARTYFECFNGMLKFSDDDSTLNFEFSGRNRRPPRDPVNALLSLAYSMLAKDFTIVLQAVGFDPFMGFFHRPRYGRPALALDLMEEMRPLVADSIVVNAINTGVVQPGDFVERGGSVALNESGRSRFLRAYERRVDELVTHPIFGYRISYRRVFEIQARLLARFLAGEIAEYPGFETR